MFLSAVVVLMSVSVVVLMSVAVVVLMSVAVVVQMFVADVVQIFLSAVVVQMFVSVVVQMFLSAVVVQMFLSVVQAFLSDRAQVFLLAFSQVISWYISSCAVTSLAAGISHCSKVSCIVNTTLALVSCTEYMPLWKCIDLDLK